MVRAGSPPSERHDRGLRSGAGRDGWAGWRSPRTSSARTWRRSASPCPTTGKSPRRCAATTSTAPADIVEEVVRIHGLDKVASVALPRADGVARPTATPGAAARTPLRRAAAGARAQRSGDLVVHFRGRGRTQFGGGGLWVLENPISEDMKVMRPSLLPGLLAAVAAQPRPRRG